MGATFRQGSQSVLHPVLCGKSVLQQKSGVNVYSDAEMIGNAHLSLMTGLSCIFLPLIKMKNGVLFQ